MNLHIYDFGKLLQAIFWKLDDFLNLALRCSELLFLASWDFQLTLGILWFDVVTHEWCDQVHVCFQSILNQQNDINLRLVGFILIFRNILWQIVLLSDRKYFSSLHILDKIFKCDLEQLNNLNFDFRANPLQVEISWEKEIEIIIMDDLEAIAPRIAQFLADLVNLEHNSIVSQVGHIYFIFDPELHKVSWLVEELVFLHRNLEVANHRFILIGIGIWVWVNLFITLHGWPSWDLDHNYDF